MKTLPQQALVAILPCPVCEGRAKMYVGEQQSIVCIDCGVDIPADTFYRPISMKELTEFGGL